jgi:hypothetical protein
MYVIYIKQKDNIVIDIFIKLFTITWKQLNL